MNMNTYVSLSSVTFTETIFCSDKYLGRFAADSSRKAFSLHVDCLLMLNGFNPYPTAFPYGNGMVLHFYQQQESSMTKTVHKVINRGLKTYV